MRLFDVHTHLDQYPLSEIPAILDRAADVEVAGVIIAGTTVSSSLRCVELAQGDSRIFAGVGIHPMEVKVPMDESTYTIFKEMTNNPRVLAISEVGLDRLEGAPEFAIQEQVFRDYVRLAREVNLPIIYHSRSAYPRMLEILEEELAGEIGGVAHYFQGDLETAKRCADLGFFISLARPLLRLPELQEVARYLPLEHIVLETDAYPQPFKRHRNNWTEPRHVAEVAETLAQLKGLTLEEIKEQIGRNLVRMFGSRSADFKNVVARDNGMLS